MSNMHARPESFPCDALHEAWQGRLSAAGICQMTPRLFFQAFLFSLCGICILPAEEKIQVSPGERTDDGFVVHQVESSYQSPSTLIRVLLPEPLDATKRYPVVYVLPVEAGVESRYGDGLKEIQTRHLQNKFQVVCVAPTFSHLPWYADHPTEAAIRQERYFLQAVVPYIDRTYPVQPEASGRLLLGFSKSGWGAWSLLLRHPQLFQKAVAWDAPLMMDQPGAYGSGDIFGTAENFVGYQISSLLERRAQTLGDKPRLILLGYGNFRSHQEETKTLLEKLAIPHVYRDGPQRPHDWHSGWVPEAVELLMTQP